MTSLLARSVAAAAALALVLPGARPGPPKPPLSTPTRSMTSSKARWRNIAFLGWRSP